MTTQSLPPAAPPKLRWQDARYVVSLVVLVAAAWSMLETPAAAGRDALLCFLAIVVLDALFPARWAAARSGPANSAYLLGVLRIYAVMQLTLQALAFSLAVRSHWTEAVSLAVCSGLISGTVGHACAHALGHSPIRSDKFLAWVLLSAMAYPHFMVEHYRGHHPRAATWSDPSSAQEGEGYWRFLLRAVWGEITSAYALESHRLAQRNLSWTESPLFWAAGGIAGVVLILSLVTWTGLLFFLAQALIAIGLVEAVNYIEHYGLERDGMNGFHLPFLTDHAWNTSAVFSSTLLFGRPQHSDHHVSPWVPLGATAPSHAPHLPTGYAGCMLLALVPWIWVAVMHSRLMELQRLAGADESEYDSMPAMP